MFHACVQRFDEMDENFLGRELNRALAVFFGPIAQLPIFWSPIARLPLFFKLCMFALVFRIRSHRLPLFS